jgi:hypothetical protein
MIYHVLLKIIMYFAYVKFKNRKTSVGSCTIQDMILGSTVAFILIFTIHILNNFIIYIE